MTIMYLKIINPNDLKTEFKDEIEKETNRIKEEENRKEKTVDIIWNDATITHEKVDSISFDDKKINIFYKGKVLVIPLKNVKKLKFAESLLKTNYRWTYNFKTYNDSTSDENPYSHPFVWYKYTSNIDTAGNPTW